MLNGTGATVSIHDAALLGSVLLTAVSQAMMRIGARGRARALHSFLNPWTLTGNACFGIVMLMMIYAMQTIPFRSVMAVNSLVYIATPLAARLIAKDPLTLRMMLGSLVITAGIVIFFL
jgi:drug/metabolite transporter (DMT)-like permease